MTRIEVLFWNYAHGGRRDPDAARETGDGNYDFAPMVRALSRRATWPDILVIAEAERYGWDRGEGKWGAVAAMRAAGGPAYTPLICTLPRDWGPYAPAFFVNQQTITIRKFQEPDDPAFAERYRNMLKVSVAGKDEEWQVGTGHGALSGGNQRLLDAQELRIHADSAIRTTICEDFNATLSGPWQHTDLNDPRKYDTPWRIANRILWRHGPRQAGPYDPDTRSLDYLCGYWHRPRNPRTLGLTRLPGRRIGGIGFHWVAELAGDYRPTNLPTPTGRQQTAIDGIIVNDPMKDAVVPESYYLLLLDPENPESDHYGVGVAFDL